jgi:ABC-type lipoprotein export system ATPase subunit
MTENAIVSLAGLNKWYGDFHVLRDINVDVAKGERIVICGPSGSGKSTLIRCINALEEFQEGRIVVDGIELGPNLRRVDEVRREVGMVFQSFNLFPHLTVLENCTLAPIWVRNVPKKDAEAAAMKYLERVKIPHQANKYPGQMSGGQQQRVAIARALTMNPNGQGSARHHGRSRQGGHDHDGRDPRNGIRPRSRQPNRVHGCRANHRGEYAAGVLCQPAACADETVLEPDIAVISVARINDPVV